MAFLATGKTQEQLLTIGLQYKPVLASRFLGAGPVEGDTSLFSVSIKPVWGHSFGMIMRRGFTKLFSLETGINLIRRNYRMTCSDTDSGFTDVSEFGIVAYEIPVQGLIYIQLGEKFFMNTAFGGSLNAFASDVSSAGTDRRFSQLSLTTTQWFSIALTANIGFEYRTPKSGFFYLGASLHRPLREIAHTEVKYEKNNFETYRVPLELSGSFLTVDFRYFFHSKPIKKEKNSAKNKKKEVTD